MATESTADPKLSDRQAAILRNVGEGREYYHGLKGLFARDLDKLRTAGLMLGFSRLTDEGRAWLDAHPAAEV